MSNFIFLLHQFSDEKNHLTAYSSAFPFFYGESTIRPLTGSSLSARPVSALSLFSQHLSLDHRRISKMLIHCRNHTGLLLIRRDLLAIYLGLSYFANISKYRKVSALVTIKTSQRLPLTTVSKLCTGFPYLLPTELSGVDVYAALVLGLQLYLMMQLVPAPGE
jgi:hypothetical protein